MSEDKSIVKPVAAPPLKPLPLTSKLAPTPAQAPKYSVTVKNAQGQAVILADPRASRALVALMDMCAVNGGAASHWGGPAAFAEIVSAIHGVMFAVKDRPWHEAYHFVNDAGHCENGIYALRANYGFDGLTFQDLRGFRGIKSKLTGHGESHLNPQGVLLSNGPLGSSLPQAQGLALADKVRKNDRVTICTVSDGASMEGEAKEAFAAIPGLAAKDRLNPFLLVVSDNDTKLSGRISKDAFRMVPSFEAMSVLGWNVVKVADGNNLQEVYLAVESALQQARANPRVPVCVWAKTVKGFGVRSTVESASGGHGFPLANAEKIVDFVNEIYFGAPEVPAELAGWAGGLRADWEQKEAAKKAKAASAPPAPSVKKEKIQAGLARGAVRAAQEGFPVFSVSADVEGSTGMSFFQKSFPDRFIEVGVAEANMISTGAGLAKAGFIPVVDTFGQFGVTKGNLPLTMSALSQAPVRLFARRFSGRGRRGVARGHDLLRRRLGDSAHGGHRLFLRGRGGSVDVRGDPADGAGARTRARRRIDHLFCGARKLPAALGGKRPVSMGQGRGAGRRRRRGDRGLRTAGGAGHRRGPPAQGAKHRRHSHRQPVHQPCGFEDDRAGGRALRRTRCHD
jgi:transketolase